MHLDGVHIEAEEAELYKGYRIVKSWKADYKGNRIPRTTIYQVVDDDDNWIGDCYKSLAEARRFVDEMVQGASVSDIDDDSEYIRAEAYNYGSQYIIEYREDGWYVNATWDNTEVGPFYTWGDAQNYVDEIEGE